jgi:hypothetical protein
MRPRDGTRPGARTCVATPACTLLTGDRGHIVAAVDPVLQPAAVSLDRVGYATREGCRRHGAGLDRRSLSVALDRGRSEQAEAPAR